MLRAFRRWRAVKKERRACEYAEEHGHVDPAELQHLRDQQSPVKGKWGFFPK